LKVSLNLTLKLDFIETVIFTQLILDEQKHWNVTCEQEGLDQNNITELEETAIDFAVDTFFESIPSASSTKLNNTATIELEETIIAAPPSASSLLSTNVDHADQSMQGHLASLSAHAINKIACRLRRHDVTNGLDGAINDWSFLHV